MLLSSVVRTFFFLIYTKKKTYMADSIIYTTHDNDLLNGDEDFYFFSIYILYPISSYIHNIFPTRIKIKIVEGMKVEMM